MIPAFDLQGGAALAVARGATVTALLSAFGASLFDAVVAPRARALMTPSDVAVSRTRLGRIVQGSAACGILALGLWLAGQAAFMSDATTVSGAVAALPTVLWKTGFGHVVLLQFAALAALTAAAFWPRPAGGRAAVGASAAALCLQAGYSHAFSMYQGPSLLLGCDVLHLLGAGAWLGGLVPLLLVVWTAPPRAAAAAARWFSPLGQISIVALLFSAAYQGWVLVGGVPGLVGTGYGWMVLAKLGLFGVLFGFAWFNRYRFAPALTRGDPARARRVLTRSITLQTLAALGMIAAATVLSGLPPAMHLQPLWPFAQRFSLAAAQEDPDIAWEVLQAGAALAAACALLALALARRRLRLAAGGVALAVTWFALPHAAPLLVPAYPTSFYHSPTGFAASSIDQGADLFGAHCARCHGADGAGEGREARALPVPPADLTAAHLWMHSDGELFWWISDGMPAPDGTQAMPGFAGVLDEDARWALIDYIRAHNAGTARMRSGTWKLRVTAPEFAIACGAENLSLSDVRGHFVRISIGADRDMVRVVTAPDRGPARACTTQDRDVARAYAIVSGWAVDAMAGMQFIVDPDGWLRAMQPAAGPENWNDPARLMAAIKALRAQPSVSSPAPVEAMKMPM